VLHQVNRVLHPKEIMEANKLPVVMVVIQASKANRYQVAKAVMGVLLKDIRLKEVKEMSGIDHRLAKVYTRRYQSSWQYL